jgi:hypothetical protein
MGKGLEKSKAIQVMYPVYFQPSATRTRTLGCYRVACCEIDRLALAKYWAILKTKMSIDQNRPNFAHHPVFRENPYLPRMLPEDIAPKPANSCLRLF